MDFIERLIDKVNENSGIPLACSIGVLGTKERLVMYAIPGGRTVSEFYDGMKDRELSYAFAMKTQDQEKLNRTLWILHDFLTELDVLKSEDNSFDFSKIEVSNAPYVEGKDTLGFYVFIMTITAKITTYNLLKGENK